MEAQLNEAQAQISAGKRQLAEGKAAYEEGVKKLEEGQKAYDEGAATLAEKQAEYDAGVKKLEDAKKQLAAGKKKLEEGQKEYDAGKKTYDEGKAQYDAGVAALNQAKTLQGGLSQIQSGFSTWQKGYAGLQQFQQSAKAQGVDLPAPAANNASAHTSAISSMKSKVETGLDYCDQLDTLKGQKTQLEGAVAQLEAAIAATEDENEKATLQAQLDGYNSTLGQVNAGIAQIEAGLGGQTRESLTQQKGLLDQLTGVPDAVAKGQKDLSSGLSQAINGALGNEDMAKKLTSASGMSASQLKAGASSMSSADYATFNSTMEGKFIPLVKAAAPEVASLIKDGQAKLDAAKKELDAGKAKLDAGKAELDKGKEDYRNGYGKYNNGRIQLEQGAVLLEEGKAALAEAGKQLEDGKSQLADAEKQIADGEAQLAVFEDGRDQVIAGLNTAIATEAQGGVESIADRLGAGFNFMKNETDLDIDKGLEVVAAARGYASDLTNAVTGEITGKAVGSIVAAVGAVVALIGGLLGLLLKKPAVAGVIALLGGAAAAGGAYLSASAGSAFSQIAGAGGPTLLIATGALTAVAAIPQAIAAFTAKSAAASAAVE